jgi:hypothetical protein
MKLHVLVALLPMGLAFVSAKSNGVGRSVSYVPITTISSGGPGPSITNEAPPLPTQITPAAFPSANSYTLNSSFEITATPVTRTYHWTIA